VSRYILRRLLIAVPTLIVISFVVFAILALAPTDPMASFGADPRVPPEVRERQADQSATLQAGYLILAARALGLDCGPMGGFDRAKVDAAFFSDGKWKSTLLVNLGYGDSAKLHPRNPRLDFDDACRIV